LDSSDLASIYRSIDAPSSGAAVTWYLGLKDAIRSLRLNPNRCPATPEDKGLRHFIYGDGPYVYRVIYHVIERQKEVDILHIRHGARQGFKPADLN
jgi:plasmid stabilization system protein ParE